MTDFGRRAGVMLKSVYDSDNDGVITVMHTQANMETSTYDPEVTGIVADSRKLELSTKAQVRDHAPKAHTHALPSAHKATHQDGGTDEISVAGLSGLLADDQGKGEGHILLEPLSYSSIVQGSYAVSGIPAGAFKGAFYNASAADGDEYHLKAFLAAGTYALTLLSDTKNNRGILDIFIDNDEVASFDLYTADLAKNVRNTQAGIVVSSAGIKTIKFRLDGKNGSSSSYMANIQSTYLYRTA